MKHLLLLSLSLILLLSSCGPTLRPFTERTLSTNTWSREKLQKVQFFLSDPIILWREVKNTETDVDRKGAIKYVKGRKIEEIVFRQGLPGTFLFSPENQHFAIGFEADSDNYLIFGPSKKRGGRYVLLAKEWNEATGTVTYGGAEWKTSYKSAYAYLNARIQRHDKVHVKGKKIKGRTVQN